MPDKKYKRSFFKTDLAADEKQRQLAALLAMTQSGVPVGPGLPNIPRQANMPPIEPGGPAMGMDLQPRQIPGMQQPTLAEALARAVEWQRSQR